MPFANTHSARLRMPGEFDPKAFRQTDGGRQITIKDQGQFQIPKNINIIWGKLKGKAQPEDPPIAQALRFSTSEWTEKAARDWLKKMEITPLLFEPATDSMKEAMFVLESLSDGHEFVLIKNEEPEIELQESSHNPNWDILHKNKMKLTEEERTLVMTKKAVWHHGPNGEETPAVWKSMIEGKAFYVTNTHRAFNVAPTVEGAINRYHKFIKLTAAEDLIPRNKQGLTVSETFVAAQNQGKKFSKEASNFLNKAPDYTTVCGTCRFYLRNPDGSETGLCQVVEGPIPWFSTSDLYINAGDEAKFAFSKEED